MVLNGILFEQSNLLINFNDKIVRLGICQFSIFIKINKMGTQF